MTEDTVQGDAVSQGFDQDAGLDSQDRMDLHAAAILQDLLPEDDELFTPDTTEVSVEETETTDDTLEDEDVEADETEDDTEEVLDDNSSNDATTDLEQVDYDEIKNYLIPIKVNGEVVHMNIDQLNSEVGRARSASKDVEDVKAQKELVATELQQASEVRRLAETDRSLAQARAQIDIFGGHINSIQRLQDQASNDGNQEEWQKLEMQIRPMINEYEKATKNLEIETAQQNTSNLQAQQQILASRGYDNILSDPQRVDALGKFVSDNLSPSTAALIDSNAEILILAEEARQWRKSKEVAKQGKLKGNGKKTIRSGNGKVAKSQTSKQTEQLKRVRSGRGSEADSKQVMDAIAREMLGGI